jgi:hypothetical protein
MSSLVMKNSTILDAMPQLLEVPVRQDMVPTKLERITTHTALLSPLLLWTNNDTILLPPALTTLLEHRSTILVVMLPLLEV